MTRISAPRDHSLDALRAAMMLLGLVLHSAASYTANAQRTPWPYQDAQTHVGFDLLVFTIHIFRMPVFFVIAGFFGALLYHRDGPMTFLRNRIKRVLLPLVVFWVLIIPVVGMGFLFALRQTGGDLDALQLKRGSILEEPMLGHLWFLYNLLIYYAAAAACVPLAARLPAGVRAMAAQTFRAVATMPWGIAVLAAVTMVPILQGGEPGIGLSASLRPRASVLIAYAMFFAFGWCLHGQRDALTLYGRRWGKTAVVAVATGAAYLAVVAAQQSGDLRTGMLTAAAVSALATWLLIFAIIGWFVRQLPRPRPIVRYFSDAAYWSYLVHLPLTIWVPGLLAQSSLGALAKFTVVLVVTALVTTATYELMVRATRIGAWLNGRRYPRGLPASADVPNAAV